MSKKCQKDHKPDNSGTNDKFTCKKCGATAGDKAHLCKPEKKK